jgi:flagellar biosynthetic protein FlhB
LFRQLLTAAAGGDFRFVATFSSGVTVFRGTGLAIALSWLAATIVAAAQGGVVFVPSSLAPTLSRMSPASRLRQLFSLPAAGRLAKSLVPVAVMVYLAVQVLIREWMNLLHLPQSSLNAVAGMVARLLFEICWKGGLVLLVWSAVDYLLERRKLESDLRMSRQELLDEYKETEGNPAIKARIRRLQRQVRRRRMLEEVKRAAVVITNPTQFAVALEYGPHLAAPTVVAKGRNLLAQQIKQIARWQDIPMVENPPLAHALYRAVEVGQSIPPKLYAVVAGILAAIYRAQERAAAQPRTA